VPGWSDQAAGRKPAPWVSAMSNTVPGSVTSVGRAVVSLLPSHRFPVLSASSTWGEFAFFKSYSKVDRQNMQIYSSTGLGTGVTRNVRDVGSTV